MTPNLNRAVQGTVGPVPGKDHSYTRGAKSALDKTYAYPNGRAHEESTHETLHSRDTITELSIFLVVSITDEMSSHMFVR